MKIAYELLPALLLSCSRIEAAFVLCEVLGQVYGKSKRKAAVLEPAKLARRSGRRRQAIWKGITELVDKGIIVRLGDGSYRFEKDYEKWRSDQGPLIESSLVQYIASYPLLVKSYDAHGAGSSRDPHQGSISIPADEKRDPCQGSHRDPHQGSLSESPPTTPPIRSENGELTPTTSTNGVAPRDRTLHNEHRKTVEHARGAFGDGYAEVVVEMGRDIDLTLAGHFDCYRAGIDAAKQLDHPIRNLHAWVIRTAGKFRLTGIPPAPFAVEPTPREIPLTPAQLRSKAHNDALDSIDFSQFKEDP